MRVRVREHPNLVFKLSLILNNPWGFGTFFVLLPSWWCQAVVAFSCNPWDLLTEKIEQAHVGSNQPGFAIGWL